MIQLHTEPVLIRRLVGRRPSRAARVMANTSGLIGLLGLVVNQLGGKLSDQLGRRPFFAVGPFVCVVVDHDRVEEEDHGLWAGCHFFRRYVLLEFFGGEPPPYFFGSPASFCPWKSS